MWIISAAIAGRMVKFADIAKMWFRLRSCLLAQLTLAAFQRSFAALQLPSRQLKQFLAVGVTVLPHKQQLSFRREGGDCHATGMFHNLARGPFPIWLKRAVSLRTRDDSAGIDRIFFKGFFF